MQTDPNSSSTPTTYQPTEEQLERRKRLRRFNLWSLVLPLTLLGLLVLGSMGLLIWQTWGLEPSVTANNWRIFVSAAADLIIIFTTFMALLSCLIFPVLVLSAGVFGWQQEWRPISQLQTLIWRAEAFVDPYRARIESISQQAAERVIQGRSWWAQVEAFIRWIRFRLFGR